jgi:hypothetical protein
MFRIALPYPDTSLLLSPRWSELSPLGQLGMVLLLLAPPILVVWLYRYEMRLIKRSTALRLLTLRMLALALLLFIVLLQPIVQRTTKYELPGRVIFAVDRSESMDVADPQRPNVDKLRLARALKLAGDICPDAQLDAWIKQYEQKNAIVWVAADEFPQEPQKRPEAEKQRREQHHQVCKRVDDLTRTKTAQRVLGDGLALLPTISAKHQTELLGFTQEQWELKPDQLEQLFQPPPSTRVGTDLGLPLIRALEHSGPDQGKLLGIVVLTDGQHNWEQSPVPRAAKLGEQGVPIYPVALGSNFAPPNLAILRAKAPATVFKDVDAGVDTEVLVTGLPRQKIVVELARQGQPPLKETIEHDGIDRRYPVHFQVRLDKVGTQTLAVTAKADPNVPPPAGKLRTDQSSKYAVVNVADDKAKVLLIDGEARYDFHYLSMALRRDRTMQVSSVVFDQPRLGKVPEDELRKVGNPALTMPAEPDALASYDCIVLGDVTPEQLPAPERVRLEKFVADRGGTLVIVAGKHAMPLAYAGGDDPIRRLLPIENPRPFESVRGAALRFTEDGERSPFLRLEDGTPEKSRERWSLLPPHYWGIIGKAKPGATVLASFNDGLPPRPEANPKDDPARAKALIARQNYGFGRVLYLGIDSSWRWRKFEADKYHHRFWGQLVRWAAADKPLVTGNEVVRFGTREPVYNQGDEVEIVVRIAEDVPPLAPDSRAGARILKTVQGGAPGEEAVALVMLEKHPAQPRVLEGKVRDLPPGQYLVELAIPELADRLLGPTGPDGQPTKLRASFTVTPRDSAEMTDLATNWPLLQELATKSGGTVYTPETVAALGEKLKAEVVTRESSTERKLWQEWATLILFLGLLTLEWVGRKIAGLP